MQLQPNQRFPFLVFELKNVHLLSIMISQLTFNYFLFSKKFRGNSSRLVCIILAMAKIKLHRKLLPNPIVFYITITLTNPQAASCPQYKKHFTSLLIFLFSDISKLKISKLLSLDGILSSIEVPHYLCQTFVSLTFRPLSLELFL